MIYTGVRSLIKHNSYDEKQLRDIVREAKDNIDLIKKVENEGYHYLGTNCCDEMAFIKNFKDCDEFVEFHVEKLGH